MMSSRACCKCWRRNARRKKNWFRRFERRSRLQLITETLPMTESTPGQNEWKLAFDVAVNALVRFDHPKAIENFRRAVELAEDSLPNSVSLAESLEGLGQSLWYEPASDESAVY